LSTRLFRLAPCLDLEIDLGRTGVRTPVSLYVRDTGGFAPHYRNFNLQESG